MGDSPSMELPLVESNWQSALGTAVSRLSYMLDKQILTDIHFIVGKETKECISAHQFVLSMSSPVFFTMFNGSVELTDDKIVLPDIEPQALRILLKYIYSEVVDLDVSSAIPTLYASKKYQLPLLEEACEKYLFEKVSSENVFCLLAQAKFFDRPQLVDLCLRVIDTDAERSFESNNFLEIDHALLCEVLSRDTLYIKERTLFKFVVRWALEQCKRQSLEPTPENQRSVLKEALFLVRFPLMKPKDFSKGPVSSGLLTKKEIIDTYIHFTVKEKQALMFPTTPRRSVEMRLKRFSNVAPIGDYYFHNGTNIHESMEFFTDRAIIMTGFGIHGSSQIALATYSVTIHVMQSNKIVRRSHLESQVDSELGSDESFEDDPNEESDEEREDESQKEHEDVSTFSFKSINSTETNPFVYFAKFPKPIRVLARRWCSVSTHLSGSCSVFIGVNGLSKITTGSHPNEVKFRFSDSCIYTRGVVAEIIFAIAS